MLLHACVAVYESILARNHLSLKYLLAGKTSFLAGTSPGPLVHDDSVHLTMRPVLRPSVGMPNPAFRFSAEANSQYDHFFKEPGHGAGKRKE